MKFALILTNLAGGGAERSMLRLGTALLRRGHAVRTILLEARIEHEVPANAVLDILAPRVGKGFVGKWQAAWRLRRHYARNRLQDHVAVSTLPFADEVAIRAQVPGLWCRITNTLSAEVDQLARHRPAKAARRLARYRRLYENRRLVAVSQGVEADLRGAIGLQRARIRRIYNGLDLDAIRLAAAEPPPDLPQEPFVLHAGRFAAQKRHDLLLDAWTEARLPHRLVLLTQSDPRLEALVRERGLQSRVTIAGFRANPYPWMRAAELLVLSSDREGMPSVLVEALASGTRVVSTDCPSGPREVLRGPMSRWLVPPGDARALAAAMRAALASPRPGPSAVPEEFTEAHMVRAYEALGAG
ncbi:MAG TPA: glycosyltransferase [Burkholderiales bacterium]|nr:glycosyltransferase [Burkholderiales bacterium]